MHAAGESLADPHWRGTGRRPSIHVVVLAAEGETQLEWIAYQLDRANIPHVVIREPDPPYYGVATAIGVLPVEDRRIVRRVLNRLELLQ